MFYSALPSNHGALERSVERFEMWTFYEFFAGGGMARLGLGPNWRCLFANDIDSKKTNAYRTNFAGAPELLECDVAKIKTRQIPGSADLVWASFPCQDLSLAGYGAGLSGNRSGTFWPFWKIVERLIEEERRPSIIVVENVCGTLNSHGGHDFKAICDAFSHADYKFGAVVLDAANFVPQSRPRLFVIGVTSSGTIPEKLSSRQPNPRIHSRSLISAQKLLSPRTAKNWVWWNLPVPQNRVSVFADLVEANPTDVSWDSLEETRKILSQMSPLNLAKVQGAQMKRQRLVGCIYKRTRPDKNGIKVQRAEVRFDDIAGCLRTPGGGSSRQRILVVQGNKIRTRLLSSREAARLMGLPESYILPSRYSDAYHLTGDGVAVPVVRWLAQQLFEEILASTPNVREVAMAAA